MLPKVNNDTIVRVSCSFNSRVAVAEMIHAAQRSLCLFRGGFAVIFLFTAPAGAETAVERMIDGISLDPLDQIISDADLQLSLLKAGREIPGEGDTTVTATLGDDAGRGPLARTRGNLLCFADNLGQQRSVSALDGYFNTAEDALVRGQAFLSSFELLKGNFAPDNCPPVLTEMSASAATEVGSVSRSDMAVLILHLETCWPDETASEADGTPFDVDARYFRARDLMQSLQRVGLGVRAAQEWCQ